MNSIPKILRVAPGLRTMADMPIPSWFGGKYGSLIAAAILFAGIISRSALAQRTGAFVESYNHPAIRYSTTDANTVVDELNRKLADGSATLTFDPQSGYLKSVLDLLNVPVESQVLVYTQTSQQAEKIFPGQPARDLFQRQRRRSATCAAAASSKSWRRMRGSARCST